MVRLQDFPTEILLQIFQHLFVPDDHSDPDDRSIPDVLALKQTCRVFHALGSSDYLWHRIVKRFRLPLDLPPAPDHSSLPAFELQRSIIRALRLECNWRKPHPSISACTAVVHGTSYGAIDEMQLLPGARWLVTAQRLRRMGRPMTTINLWSLNVGKQASYHAGSVDVAGQYKRFAAALNKGADGVTLAITTYAAEQVDHILRIHEMPLRDRSTDFREPILRKAFPKPVDAQGVIHEVAVQDEVVAAMFVNFEVEFPGHSYQIFLVNTTTWVQKLIHPKFREPLNRLSLRLSSERLILVGATTDTIVIRVLHLPYEITQPSHSDQLFKYRPATEAEEEIVEDLGYLAELNISSCPNPIDSDTLIYHSLTMPGALSLLFFDLLDAQPGHGHLVRLVFGVDDGAGPSHCWHDEPFPFPAETSVKLVRIGSTGRRAIWIEQNWETDEKRVMRSHFPAKGVGRSNVGVLLPHEPALPFQPRECQSLAFDEATGRVCLGLFNGDLWVLDFN
ncbi:hypothetical protein FA95DRAFT_795932 [Auriscalpium vulgare]|uniref:Uncharacterized protein n=1 Tax=Auriscalpium vulgare TaxID=40419 RepID=A0ACB8RZM3_9AGAM|nr:hypothetical protein FA95DRAFT_795932 [Auriscalpium vulgare]